TNGSAHFPSSFSFCAHRIIHIDLSIGGTLHTSTVRNVEGGNLNPRNSAKPFSNVDDFVDTQSIQHQSSAIAFNRPATTLSTTIGYVSFKFSRFQYVPKSDSGPGGRRFKSSRPDFQSSLASMIAATVVTAVISPSKTRGEYWGDSTARRRLSPLRL